MNIKGWALWGINQNVNDNYRLKKSYMLSNKLFIKIGFVQK
ncbi:hypothetical protein JMA_29320 [Jeotgalibacillus malaysiensis]|uniref:Uncharacterized protein n=1 Tax=Jeotgalibacillus malaysiensis TaxID=1508404 RepID=A0A0B5AW47_9BACL|nr:hypothetical protein JMA_29320 [Jeotgalibacillus malaysiensis]